MGEYIGIVTKSTTGEGTLKMLYPAGKVALVNDSGTLGIIPEGNEKGISAIEILAFSDVLVANVWLQEK